MFEIIKTITHVFLPTSLLVIALFCAFHFKKPRIYRSDSAGWLSIKDHPIPEDMRDFIATDGKNVEYIHSPKWGPHGKVYFESYKETFITHWQPLPDIPKKQ